MRLITRGDLDGLAAAAILAAEAPLDTIVLAHPQDVARGRLVGTADDVVVNLPYLAGCGLWFDHKPIHGSDPRPPIGYRGRWDPGAASAAGLVWQHFGKEPRFAELVTATDRFDAGRLERDDVLAPRGFTLLAYTLDGRSGLGSFEYYFRRCIEWVSTLPIEAVLALPLVENRIERLRAEEARFREVLEAHTRLDGRVAVTDLRRHPFPPAGNRFLVYALFPDATVGLRLHWGPRREVVVAAAGRSVLTPGSTVDLGALLARWGGGGHARAASAPLPPAEADAAVAEIVRTINREL